MRQARRSDPVAGDVPQTLELCSVTDCAAATTVSGFAAITSYNPIEAAFTTLCGTPKPTGVPCAIPMTEQICVQNTNTFGCAHSPITTPTSPATSKDSTPTTSENTAFQQSTPATTPVSLSSTSTSGPSSSSSLFSTASGTGNNGTLPVGTMKPTSSSVAKSTGISSGGAAGIAIGCLIAGALLAAAVFFFLFQRYKKRQQAQHAAYTNHLGPYNGAAAAAPAEKALPTVTAAAVSPIDTLLPQPAEDDAITGELSRLRDKIKNHAQTFYHTAAVDPVMVDESELQDIARATGIRSMSLCDMLLNPQTRISTIRLFLSYAILSRCGGQGGAGASLLPPEVGLFADALAGTDGSDAGQLALKSKWHSISAKLLSSRYSSGTISDSDPRSRSIAAIITAVDGVLRPFVSTHQDDTQRLRNLQGVIQRAASFAFLLFSQPSTFRFQWSAHGNLVVFPALLQTSDENARVLNPPRVFVDMEGV